MKGRLPFGAIAMLAATLFHPAIAASNSASPEQHAGGAYLFVAHDTEGFDTYRTALEYLPDFTHGDALAGIRYTYHTYSQNNWRRVGQQVSLIQRAMDPATANGWYLNTGVFQQGSHGMLTLDGDYRRPLAAKTGLDVFIDREWVETQLALDQGVHFTFLGASIDQGLGQHWTAVAVAGRQDFSDGNQRIHYRAKLIFQPLLDSGLTLQCRYRTYHSSASAVGGTYFNPTHYDKTLLALAWRKRVQGWVLKTTAGAGRQHIDGDPGTITRLLEIMLDSPYRGNQFVRLRGGYDQSAEFSGPNYAYTYLQGEWILRF